MYPTIAAPTRTALVVFPGTASAFAQCESNASPVRGDCDRHAVRFRVELQVVHAGQVARLNRTEPNTLVGDHGSTPSTE